MRGGRDARVVRRALGAGGLVWAVLGLPLLALVVVRGGRGDEGFLVVALTLVLGAIVASGWLLLAAALDLLAGESPGRRRVAWTIGVVAFTLLSPLLAAGATR